MTRQVVIVSGIRRCGKSSLLRLFKDKMGLSDPGYCYFNFDDERISRDPEILGQIHEIHLELFETEPVFFFDEIQNVSGWEKFINRMYERGSKIFVTGSNARLLSSEISTSLTGRNRVLALYPFSFSEYLKFRGIAFQPGKLSTTAKARLRGAFHQYMETGGFPLIIQEQDLELIHSYFQDILYRDIISRYRISQVDEIRQIGIYFASNIGKLFSYSTLQQVSGVKSTNSIKEYLEYYRQAWLFYYLRKFDYSIRKQIMNPKKVYTADPALANRLGMNFSANKGRVAENIVYVELLRRGCDVYYHSGKNECDFLIREGLKITGAIQVCITLHDGNETREMKGLAEAMEIHQLDHGLLLTLDDESEITFNGKKIITIPIWKWLIENN
jgi:hypothetical protein